MAEFLDDVRDAELFERRDLRRDEPEDGAIAVGLLEIVAAEARVLVHLVGKIEIAAFLEPLPAPGRRSRSSCRRFLVGEGFVADGHDFAMPPDFRRLAFARCKIGAAAFDEDFEKLIDVGHE